MGIIYDLILLAIVIFTVWRAYRRGFLRTLLSLVGSIISLFAAYYLARWMAGGLTDMLVRPWFTGAVEEQLAATGIDNLQLAFEQMYENLPVFFTIALEALVGSAQDMAAQIGSAVSAEQVSGALYNAVSPFFQVLVSSILFLVLMIAFRLAYRVLNRFLATLRRIPVLGTFDGILGALLGIVQAALLVIILVILVQITIYLTNDELTWLNEQIIHSSFLLRIMYSFQLFQFI